MVLVDTSVWIQHLRSLEPGLVRLLQHGLVYQHPFVIGELACGNLNERTTFLDLLGSLPASIHATHPEALTVLEQRKLYGTGLGWVDLHLLASALLSGCRLWSLDRRLDDAARVLGVRYEQPESK